MNAATIGFARLPKAVRAAGRLRQLRSIGRACARALFAVEVLAAAHA
jgi:hypothetical protein